ncbi:MAG: response regulator [Lachnospiraceae bacterium]|nr:response regulator [Lachnospiraceae bacterium]
MSNNRIMVIGEKETFLIRVLLKKLNDAGIENVFVPWDVDHINSNWEGIALITVYMDDERRPPDKVVYFLKDKMNDEGLQMIAVGEKVDLQDLAGRVPSELIYRTFPRPLDNDEYVRTVSDLITRMQAGEFRKSILVVDDDPGYLNLVREWLKGTYKVTVVTSGLQAIKWLGKNKADLILLDHEMPVTSGPQVLEMLRSDSETKDIPVMFLTGKSDKQSVMAVVALKPEGYFLKTIDREELLMNLKEFFIRRK